MTQKTPSSCKVRVRGLTKSFGDKKVLHGVDLDLGEGESLVVIGGSGTGKSVLIKCILGLIQPDRGQIEICGNQEFGDQVRKCQPDLHKVGMLFQGSALFDSLKVWENVAFALLQEGKCSRAEGRVLAIEKLAAVGMEKQVADLYPVELSGGMQRRVALARAIAYNPDIIFFDEPTTGLDPIVSSVINNLIVECVKGLGASAITITHDIASARTIGDRVAMLHGGKIIWVGPAKSIDQSGDPMVDQFIHGRAEGPIQMG